MIRRIHDLHAVFTSEELGRLHQRMAESGVRNRSSFIRKMALDGYIVKLDMDEISEMIRLLRISSNNKIKIELSRQGNNLNQIAKKINATGSVYGAEIAEMQVKQDEIWELAKEILARLSMIQ